MEKVWSERGSVLMCYKNFIVRKTTETLQGWKWRCAKKTYSAKIYLDDNETVVFVDQGIHNHDPSEYLCRRNIFSNIKRKAEDDITGRPEKVMSKEIYNSPLAEDIYDSGCGSSKTMHLSR